MQKKLHVVLTCEHGGCEIPARFAPLFRGKKSLLKSHRGYDPGALQLARHFAKTFRLPLFYSTTSRLLVELNRSLHHPNLFSEVTRPLDKDERQLILDKYYYPHRDRIENHIAQLIRRGKTVVHLGVHTFTPKLNGEVRRIDVGILYAPRRPMDKKFSLAWQEELNKEAKDLRVRRNYPYRGSADGFIPYLSKKLKSPRYIGLEVEVNQCHYLSRKNNVKPLQSVLSTTFERTVNSFLDDARTRRRRAVSC